ncbi:MAG: hypothetical protein COX19_01345, partial [Desulfobacterales bacterium CG23_combo_of_CG06-09_8_20_14_all_51_8]
MKRFFIHADGRLKTGRVAFLVFLSVMVGCSLVYYASQPVDKITILVKHIFEPETKAKVPDAKVEASKETSVVPEK